MPDRVDLVRGLEDLARGGGHALEAGERAASGHLRHQGLGVEALPPGEPLEGLAEEGQHTLAVRALHAMLEGQREHRLDAEEHPAIIEMVPVGAMVVTVALRSGRPWR